MRVLAIDSSGLTATVAIVEDDTTIAEFTINYKKTHSQTLLPMIDEMVKMVEADLDSIDAIAVAGGPGSFTGLRIGSATAKGLGLALGKPLIHIPTADAMAYSIYGCEDIICPIMDARRNQVYTGIYSFVPMILITFVYLKTNRRRNKYEESGNFDGGRYECREWNQYVQGCRWFVG